MTASLIVVGPQGCGKTINARRLALAFGLKHWTEADSCERLPRFDHLILANEAPRNTRLRVIGFEDAIKKVAKPHPATPRGRDKA